MTRAEIKQLAYYRMQETGERQGQAIWNILCSLFPECVEQYRGSVFDPFYSDARVDAFLEILGIN